MRVVSLVPSATETLLALGVEPVACTRFCEQPALRHVGGTKNPDVAAIVELAPDLVVVNDEENRREDADALAAEGLRLHSMSPRSIGEVGPAVWVLADEVGAEVPDPFPRWARWLEEAAEPGALRAFIPVWRRPWMTLNDDTYGASLLSLLGVVNVFGDAPERYPSIELDEVARTRPDVALLPSEPYPFRDRHVGEVVAALGVPAVLVDGRDLFWWGIRTPAAIERLSHVLGTFRAP